MTDFTNNEKILSQLPALELLIHMGYSFLSPKEALKQRQNRYSQVLQEEILREKLKEINSIRHKGGDYLFSEENILGKQYRLRRSEGMPEKVKLKNGSFRVVSRTAERTKVLLEKWYRDKAGIIFLQCLDDCWPRFQSMGLSYPVVQIKKLEKRWGSLTKSGTMTLNLDLIKAPKECIEYVITHELCHLQYHAHSPEFYRLLESAIPQWEKIKHKLEMKMV